METSFIPQYVTTVSLYNTGTLNKHFELIDKIVLLDPVHRLRLVEPRGPTCRLSVLFSSFYPKMEAESGFRNVTLLQHNSDDG